MRYKEIDSSPRTRPSNIASESEAINLISGDKRCVARPDMHEMHHL